MKNLKRGICNYCGIEITETMTWINDGYPFKIFVPLYCDTCLEDEE
tara:strand:- start:105 stop:242 length:138 start_codon:yes stop_codon:yes gene_type:complete